MALFVFGEQISEKDFQVTPHPGESSMPAGPSLLSFPSAAALGEKGLENLRQAPQPAHSELTPSSRLCLGKGTASGGLHDSRGEREWVLQVHKEKRLVHCFQIRINRCGP